MVMFGAQVMDHEDKAGALREMTFGVNVPDENTWNVFRTLICYNLQQIPMPWGNTVEVQVVGGPGSGTLTIPGLTPTSYVAYLTALSRTWTNSISGISVGKATFLFASQ
jgi:hypothetical protein